MGAVLAGLLLLAAFAGPGSASVQEHELSYEERRELEREADQLGGQARRLESSGRRAEAAAVVEKRVEVLARYCNARVSYLPCYP